MDRVYAREAEQQDPGDPGSWSSLVLDPDHPEYKPASGAGRMPNLHPHQQRGDDGKSGAGHMPNIHPHQQRGEHSGFVGGVQPEDHAYEVAKAMYEQEEFSEALLYFEECIKVLDIKARRAGRSIDRDNLNFRNLDDYMLKCRMALDVRNAQRFRWLNQLQASCLACVRCLAPVVAEGHQVGNDIRGIAGG